jgi:hypothetical protein
MKWRIVMTLFAGWRVMTGNCPASSPPEEQGHFASAGGTTSALAPLPTGEEVVRRMLNRSVALAAATNGPTWSYDKRAVVARLDGNAKVKEKTEKLYRMEIIHGVPFQRLVKLEGRDLTDAEIQKENRREAAFREKISGRDPKASVTQRQALVTKEVIERFDCQALRREIIQGHETIVVSFEPKPGKDDGTLPERLFSRLAGTLWVDETTWDVARLEVHLTKGFSMGMFGLMGAVKECHMELASRPMADGTWLPEKSSMSISARMLLSKERFQMEETSANFALAPAVETAQP